MRSVFLLLFLTSCSLQHSACVPERVQCPSSPERPPKQDNCAERETPPADAGGSLPSHDAGAELKPESNLDAEDDFLPRVTPTGSGKSSNITVWAVIGKKCEKLTFHPHAPTFGIAFMLGHSIGYELRGNLLELKNILYFEGVGTGTQYCRTEFRIGPGPTLGGANVYHSESECRRDLAGALPLDDSTAITALQCRGATLPVKTDEVQCGYGYRGATTGKQGCITLLRTIGPEHQRR